MTRDLPVRRVRGRGYDLPAAGRRLVMTARAESQMSSANGDVLFEHYRDIGARNGQVLRSFEA